MSLLFTAEAVSIFRELSENVSLQRGNYKFYKDINAIYKT